MSTVTVCRATAVQVLPTPSESAQVGGNLPPGSQVLSMAGATTGGNHAVSNPGLMLVVTGTAPGVTVSATAQPLCSNDGIHWTGYGAALASGSGPSPVMATASGTGNFLYYSGYVQAISAGATAQLIINA